MGGGLSSTPHISAFKFLWRLWVAPNTTHTITWGICMHIIARLIAQFELEVESLESLIELSKGADIEVHKNIIIEHTIVSMVLAFMVNTRNELID